ncbi:hypothetical protein CCACVL1_28757 [Corchorus capsularis]|uniref:Treslin n=1 Tax=Corchorus capsularis TaxID=210143 RepID=A0A1R3G5A8_COCAP|nr:hypothetical protein CCACVL1_28757 [Corchorus capsularis]
MAKEVQYPFPEYSKTQRIVLLIDLNPLLHLQDPNPYLKAILSSSETLLAFPPLSSSLFSFKPFFSSLSPLLSSSKLPFPSFSLSFDRPDSTLNSLSRFLSSILTTINKASFPLNPSRASNLAAFLRQLVHDYAWDPLISDSVSGTLSNSDSSVLIRSNLVVLFSPLDRDLDWLRVFFDVEIDNDSLTDLGAFVKMFSGVFESVNNAFVSRDIHCCWVDVKFQSWEIEDFDNLGPGFLETGIRSLGWGFCSTNSIVLGSALIPFGLIYPKIGVLSNCFRGFDTNDDSDRKMNAQLSLEILDANGKPLECKCCELEFFDFKMCSGSKHGDVLFTHAFSNSQIRSDDQKHRSLLEQYCNGVTKIHVRTVRRYDDWLKLEGHFLNPIIVRESLGNSRKKLKDNSSDFYADGVLRLLARDMGESLVRKPVPIWQIFLSFLYREGYWALVSLSDGKCDLHIGILKPFTVSSALLCIIEDGFCPNNKLLESCGVSLAAYLAKPNDETTIRNFDSKQYSEFLNSQSHPSTSNNYAGKRKKNKKNLHLLHDLTWSAFCQAAAGPLKIDLEEGYLSRDCNNSKKLKFLKCWMKQVKNCRPCSLNIPEGAKPDQDAAEEINHRVHELPQDSEQPASCSASVGEGSSRILDEAGNDFCSGTLENFFGSLPNKIAQGLESGEVELGAFAERLVSSCIYWLYQKHEIEDNSESQSSQVKGNDACASKAAVELTELLLREPKDLAAMHRRRDPSSQASDSRSIVSASDNIVREYELQILFRMEILQSEVSAVIEELMKQKFVKQICSLLESIQCHLDGGFFGEWRLDKYVEKIIKSRYYHSLRDVVDKIYTKMDLLLFDDEDELPNHLFNSEDSDQSWKENPEKDVNYRKNEPDLIENKYPQLLKNDKSPQVIRTEEHARKLIEAQGRRERARRFSSFTSWMPDLQRVWAPKQLKTTKPKSDPLQKLSKRKKPSRASYDMVCETPMTEKKRSSAHRNSIDDEEDHEDCGTHTHSHVSKALFQDGKQ